MKRDDSVDAYIAGAEFWQDELRQLRQILNSTQPEETVKWGAPCYSCEAKREETKIKRLEKIIPLIVAGVGLNDKYRNC